MTHRHNDSTTNPEEVRATATRTWIRFCEPAAVALVLLATICVYQPSLSGRFLWDDDANVTHPDLQSPAGLYRIWFEFGATQQYYPLLHTAFWIEHKLWGDRPTGYHIISLIWHLISIILVYAIVKRLRIPGALIAAALFALHPVIVESVAWITEQKNTLSTVFYLSSLLLYLRFDESRKASYYWGALILFAMAILAKSAIVTLPAALLVIFWWQRGAISWRRDVLPLVPFFLVAVLMGLATCRVEWNFVGTSGAEFELTPVQRFLLAGRAIWFYLSKLFWPAELIFIYPRWEADPREWRQWIFPIAVLAMTAALWAIRHRSRAPLAAWLFFCGTLLPMLPFLNQYVFLYTFVSDHFLYVASLGIIALVSGIVGTALDRLPLMPRLLAGTLCVGIVAVLAVKSWSQSKVYVNTTALFQSTIDRNPKCWMAYNNLGVFLIANHDATRAMEYFRASLQVNPKNPQAHANLGSVLSDRGEHAKAIDHLQSAIQLAPGFIAAYNNLGIALSKAGRLPEAIQAFSTELSFAPKNLTVLNNLAVALFDSKRYSEAASVAHRAVERQPDDPVSHYNYGNALSRMGNVHEALEQFRLAAQLKPDFAEAHYNLGLLFADLNQDDEALSHFEQAVRLKPDVADFQNWNGNLLRKTGRSKEAIEHYRAALRLDPNWPATYANLAQALAAVGRTNEAIAATQQGIEIARSARNQATSRNIEEWLKDYQAELRNNAGHSIRSPSTDRIPDSSKSR